MRRRGAVAVGVEEIVAEWIRARVGRVFIQAQSRIGDVRILAVVVAAERPRLAGADTLHDLAVDVVQREVQILAGAVSLLPHVIDQETGSSDRGPVRTMAIEVVAISARQRQRAGRPDGWLRSEVVDGTADGLRSIRDLRAALEDFEPLEAVDRRMVVGRVVTVRRVGQRNAVLHQKDFRRAGRIEAANADVRPQTETLLIANVQSRNFPKRLARRHDGALFQYFAVKDRDGSRKAAQPVVTAGHLAGRDNDVLRQVADAQLKPDAGLAAAERHAPHGGSESVADGA